MATSWITLHPGWYIQERRLLEHHYPQFRVDENQLQSGKFTLYGNLIIRPPGGAKKHPVRLDYPEGTPYEHPFVVPIKSLPVWKEDGSITAEPEPDIFDHRHQMPLPWGNLCLFQRETRAVLGGDILRGVDILRRAEKWFKGCYTGRWPPDTAESELESHFQYGGTDVLMPEEFFQHDLDGHGRMFFAWDIRQYWFDTNHEIPPLIFCGLTEESRIVRHYNAGVELSRIYPSVKDEYWDSGKLAAIPDLSQVEDVRMEHGYWWSLKNEPDPFHDGRGFLKVLLGIAPDGKSWDMLCKHIGSDITASDRHFFGLKYPARGGGFEWLILHMVRGNRRISEGIIIPRSDEEKRKAFENSPVNVICVHRVAPRVLHLRNTGVVDSVIAEKTVALIGLGALGSKVAELLAQAGVSHFRLCDCDHLTTGNVARHVGGINDFGALKTRVVKTRLLEINPYLEFTKNDIINGSAVSSLDRLSGFMAPANLTICTTADESVESVVNQMAVIHDKTVLYGRALRRASMGRVFLVRPEQDACKACLADYVKEDRDGKETPDDWIDVSEEGDGVVLHECGRPVIAGSAIDLSFIAALIARVSLNVLEEKAEDHNHWIWSRVPATDIDPRLAAGMTTFSGRIQPHPECVICRNPPINELLLTEDVHAKIIAVTEASPEAETGGVLLGFVDERNRAVAIRATGPGPRAEKSEKIFRRDVEYVQSEVDKAASGLGAKGQYIGEWHSHLDPKPNASPMDIVSLVGIAEAPNYLTPCPVMLIAGLDPNTKKVTSFRSWVFKVGRRMHHIENRLAGSGIAASLNVARQYPQA